MAKASYYAVTATGQTSWYDRSGNQRHGMDWYILSGPCNSEEEAKTQGEAKIGPIFNQYGMSDIYRETAHKNLHIVSKSRLREYRLDQIALEAE
jgi:hypothetical protein